MDTLSSLAGGGTLPDIAGPVILGLLVLLALRWLMQHTVLRDSRPGERPPEFGGDLKANMRAMRSRAPYSPVRAVPDQQEKPEP